MKRSCSALSSPSGNGTQRRQVELGELERARLAAPVARAELVAWRARTSRGRARPARSGTRPIARRCRAAGACGRGRTARERRRSWVGDGSGIGRIGVVKGDAILPAIRARLDAALAAPHPRYRPWRVDGATLGWLDDARAQRLGRFADVFVVADDAVAFVPALRRRGSAHGSDGRGRAPRSHADGELHRVARRALRRGARVRARRDSCSSAPRRAGSACVPTQRTSTASCAGDGGPRHVVRAPQRDEGDRSRHARQPRRRRHRRGRRPCSRRSSRKRGKKPASHPTSRAARRRIGAVHIRRAQPDGLQDETIHVHDLALAAGFVPSNQDGEAVDHRLVDLRTRRATARCHRPGPTSSPWTRACRDARLPVAARRVHAARSRDSALQRACRRLRAAARAALCRRHLPDAHFAPACRAPR